MSAKPLTKLVGIAVLTSVPAVAVHLDGREWPSPPIVRRAALQRTPRPKLSAHEREIVEFSDPSGLSRLYGQLVIGETALRARDWRNAENYFSAACREWPTEGFLQVNLARLYRAREVERRAQGLPPHRPDARPQGLFRDPEESRVARRPHD